MARFAKIGVGAGKTFDASKLSPEMRTADEQGMADALAELAALQKRIDAKEVTSGEMFGTREYLKNNYLYRMAAAVNGIYGNSRGLKRSIRCWLSITKGKSRMGANVTPCTLHRANCRRSMRSGQ